MHTLHNAPTKMKGLPVSTPPIYIKIQQKHKYKCKKAYTKLQNKLFVLENKNQFVQIISSSRTWHCPLYRKRYWVSEWPRRSTFRKNYKPWKQILFLGYDDALILWPDEENIQRSDIECIWCFKQWVSLFFRACLLQQYRHILCGPRLIKCPRLVRQIHAAQSTGQPPSLTNMIFWARERVGPETGKLTYSKGSNFLCIFLDNPALETKCEGPDRIFLLYIFNEKSKAKI